MTEPGGRTGRDVPRTGEHVPRTGEDVPRTGEDVPRTGPDAPLPPARARPPPAGYRPGAPAPSGPALARPAEVLDRAHIGDIEGAFGRIQAGEERYAGWRRRLVTFLAIVGPGLIVMVGDNDAGGVATYAQAGQNHGYSLLWVLLLLVPVLIVNQEMVVRLGAVTGVGHARLINERFGKFWGWFSVGDLFLLNFLTIVTEFIGVALSMSYFGVSPYLSVPIAAVMLIAITTSGSFRRWERAMFGFIGASLLLFIPLVFAVHPHVASIARDFVVPGVRGGMSSDAVLLIIAMVGTTVAPWQLFFQQSNVIDKRITPRFIRYERADTMLGSLVVVGGAAVILVATVYAVLGTPAAGHFTSALGVAEAFGAKSGFLGAVFALVLLDASIIGAAAVTLSTSYAFGDVFNLKHSLHRSFRDAKAFYGSYTAIVILAAAIVLLPGAPLGLLTTAVQALAGVLLPSATVFLLLLCNDPEVLGPWTNRRWLNIVAWIIVGILLMLSGTLVVTTLFPGVSAAAVTSGMAIALAAGVAAAYGWLKLAARRRGPAGRWSPYRQDFTTMTRAERMNWRMPPLALLKPVAWSPGTKLAVLLLRGYLVLSVLLLVVKAVQLGSG